MQSAKIIPVILAGGMGSRLWPLSRELYPKQLLSLIGHQSLLQMTIQRLQEFDITGTPLIVCNEEYRFLIAEQIAEIDSPATILLEVEGKDTAAATALAALYLQQHQPDTIMLLLPADHYIPDTTAFLTAVKHGLEYAKQNYFVTFGITPTAPATEYGYIKIGAVVGAETYKVNQFVEKPNKILAEQYLQQGEYYWNSGIFLLPVTAYITELQRFEPEMMAACQQMMQKTTNDGVFVRPNDAIKLDFPKKSLDYALMEKTQNAVVTVLNTTWSDLGSWGAVAEYEAKDKNNNAMLGTVYLDNVHNSYIRAESRVVAVSGLDNIIAIETADAILISDKSDLSALKSLVKQMQADSRAELRTHLNIHRSWGFYRELTRTPGCLVREVHVKVGAQLSLQRHLHRSEHWIVLEGEAEVVLPDEKRILKAQESLTIPAKTLHSLQNSGKITLILLEIQLGSHLEESDIERFGEA